MIDKPFTLNVDEISDETKEIARTELRETPEIVQQALLELKEYLRNDSSLYFNDDDEFLKIFLRPCKFYAKSAYEKMKKVADFKQKYSHLLDDLKPEDEKEAFTKHSVVNVLKNRDQKGRRVLIVNCGSSWEPSKVNTNQLFRIFYLIHLCALLEPETQVRGVVVIMDFNGLSMKQVAALNLQFSTLLLAFIQEVMPLRLKEVHIVKEPWIFKIVWKIFSPLMREKLKKRTTLHGSKMDKLHDFIDKNYLPKDYNGSQPQIDYNGQNWFACIEGYVDFFKKWSSYGLLMNSQ